MTTQQPTNQRHTIFGAGQVGTKLAKILAARGHEVRLVRRGAAGEPSPGIEWMRGDATDREFALEAARGATTVYNCANPSDYARWDGVLEPLYRGIRETAARVDARFVQLDNLYMYGKPECAPFDESTPRRPCSAKGELRARLLDELLDAHAKGRVRATVGHASDYFGPASPNAAVIRPDVLDRIRGGKTVYVLSDPDTPHSYSYTPDVAEGLAVLGTHEEALGQRWHLPVAAQSLTTREFLVRIASRAKTQIRVRRVPAPVLGVIGWFSPLIRAVGAMSYQWDIPYVLDDTRFVETFGQKATDLDRAIDATLGLSRSSDAAATERTDAETPRGNARNPQERRDAAPRVR